MNSDPTKNQQEHARQHIEKLAFLQDLQEKGGKKACQQLELALQKLVWSCLIPQVTGQQD